MAIFHARISVAAYTGNRLDPTGSVIPQGSLVSERGDSVLVVTTQGNVSHKVLIFQGEAYYVDVKTYASKVFLQQVTMRRFKVSTSFPVNEIGSPMTLLRKGDIVDAIYEHSEFPMLLFVYCNGEKKLISDGSLDYRKLTNVPPQKYLVERPIRYRNPKRQLLYIEDPSAAKAVFLPFKASLDEIALIKSVGNIEFLPHEFCMGRIELFCDGATRSLSVDILGRDFTMYVNEGHLVPVF